MQWALPSLGQGLVDDALMHKLAIAAGDPNCFRFVRLANEWPAAGMDAGDRTVMLAGVREVGRCWVTEGVLPGPAPAAIVNHIHMPPAPLPAPHVGTTVLGAQDRFRNTISKLDPDKRAVHTGIMALPSLVMQSQAFLALIAAQAGNEFAVLSDAQVLCLNNGGVLEAVNLNVTFVAILMRALNPRLPPGLPTELEAFTQAAEWMTNLVNRRVGELIVPFINLSLKKMRSCAPDLMTPSSHVEFVRDFMLTYVSPAIMNATAVGDVYDTIAAAAAECLLDQSVVNALLRFDYRARQAVISRGHTGAPTGGSQRAINAAGGGGGGAGAPAVGGPPYRVPPTGKQMPTQYTGGPIPRFPLPASGVLLCYASRSTLGRCPYAACARQHDWTNVTPAEQVTIKRWLVDWLAKRKWEQFVLWSDSGGLPGAWPALCG